MALKKPLVLTGGQIEQLQPGDTLDAPVGEMDVVRMINRETYAILKGQPVYLFAAEEVRLARADAPGTSRVLGLVADSGIPADASGNIQTDGILASGDWTSVVGSATLTPGAVYYLSAATAGRLTTTAPSTGFVVEVGQAISTRELELSQRRPIKL